MKKLLLSLIAVFILVGCSTKTQSSSGTETIKVLATAVPHGQILEAAKPLLEKKGYNLEVVILDDYYIFNKALNDKEADANYFQHIPFFDNELKKGYDIANAGAIHLEPFGFYSQTIKSIDELKDGATIVISNSVSDNGRILDILKQNGLIEYDTTKNITEVTLSDITSNPKNLQFVEVKPELLTLAYKNNEGDLVAINGNFAIGEGLNPTKDAVILEKASSENPYTNIVAVRSEDLNSDKTKALVEVLKSDEIKKFIAETYSDGSVIASE